jgi:HK97 family phage portal protein
VSLFTREIFGPPAQGLIPARPVARRGTAVVTDDTAMRHSAVWACLRLRADLISTMPVDAYRKVLGRQVEVPKPPVLVNPGGERVDILEWLYDTQVDLDRVGNAVGVITERSGLGLPARIDLVPSCDVAVRVEQGRLVEYRIAGEKYTPENIWHERQFTLSGMHVGLSPVAYAAWSIGTYLSAQDFALDWFAGGGVPNAHLKNTQRTLTEKQASDVKQRFRTAVGSGELFVTGSDWEYNIIQSTAAQSQWLETQGATVADIARFFGCPSDMIDAAVSGQSVTYANIMQRNLQLLIMNIGPAVTRRENALSRLLSAPRYVKLNANALLRMDPQSRALMLAGQIQSRQLAPSEARELENRPPFSDAQLGEFDRLFGPPKTTPQTASTGVTP